MRSYIKKTTARGQTYYYFRPPKRFQARQIPLGTDEAAAREKAAVLYAEFTTGPNLARLEQRHRDNLRDVLDLVFRSAAVRAKARKQEFTITREYVDFLLEEQGGCCALSGLRFEYRRAAQNGWRREPYRPSIDRINSLRGYIPDNVRLVCCAVNTALSEWGDDVFWRVVKAAYKKRPARD